MNQQSFLLLAARIVLMNLLSANLEKIISSLVSCVGKLEIYQAFLQRESTRSRWKIYHSLRDWSSF